MTRHERILELRAIGKSINQIGDILGISKQAVQQHLARNRAPSWADAFSTRFKNCVINAVGRPDLFELPEHIAVRIVAGCSEAWFMRQPSFGVQSLSALRQWLERQGISQPRGFTLFEAERIFGKDSAELYVGCSTIPFFPSPKQAP